MRVLDLYCGAGGAGAGYAHAGYEVVGVDIVPQPNYPHEFVQTDALEYLTNHDASFHEFDLIHASPPCQKYSAGNRVISSQDRNPHPDLVAPTRELLKATGIPYVIENVPGAPLENPIELCGRMFGLGATDSDGEWVILDRHRLFETSWPLQPPAICRPHDRSVQVAGVYAGARRNKYDARNIRHGGYVPPDLMVLQDLMRISWMTEKELFLAIPPAYTEYIGKEFREWTAKRSGHSLETARSSR
jgi:DNA (cytosine-5)-methyltransferase 1